MSVWLLCRQADVQNTSLLHAAAVSHVKVLPDIQTLDRVAAVQGIRPQGLQKVHCRELQTVISLCISPRAERPRARQLLKHPYFDTIRQEKGSVKLSVEALAASGSAHSELAAEITGELSAGQDMSRCSSAAVSAAAGSAASFRCACLRPGGARCCALLWPAKTAWSICVSWEAWLWPGLVPAVAGLSCPASSIAAHAPRLRRYSTVDADSLSCLQSPRGCWQPSASRTVTLRPRARQQACGKREFPRASCMGLPPTTSACP